MKGQPIFQLVKKWNSKKTLSTYFTRTEQILCKAPLDDEISSLRK